MKTAKQIEGDIYNMVVGSTLALGVNGNVYRAGMRPRDSKAEDIIVGFLSGIPGQIERGVVYVNIYVPDINTENGVYVEDGRRVAEIEGMAQQWVDSLTAARSGYIFEQEMTIGSTEDEAIHQHFVVVRLSFRYH